MVCKEAGLLRKEAFYKYIASQYCSEVIPSLAKELLLVTAEEGYGLDISGI
jgi:hypothetical protein